MERKYKNEQLGRLVQEHIGNKPGDSLEAAVKLARKLPLSDLTCFAIVNGLMSGNVLGNFSKVSGNTGISLKDHAIRLSHYLNVLEVPEYHTIISMSKEILRDYFVYPPNQEFPHKGRK